MANNLAVIESKPQVPAFSFSDMQNMATAFARGGMFGSQDPHAVLSLMLVAQAEGKHPAQIMQDYHVVQGKPAKKADAMLRDFIGSGGKVEWHELTDQVADATFSHPQGGSVRITWDDERVKQAQLGSNPMHKKYPRQMKRSRCVSEGVRTVFPGATGGFYVPEEVADIAAEDRPAKPAPKRQEAIADDKRAKAEEWAEAHIAEIAETDDPEGLAERTAGAVAKLEKAHPDLFERVAEAWRARRAEEGGDNGQEDESAPPPSTWIKQIDACEDTAALGKVEAAWLKDGDGDEKVQRAIETMREALKRKGDA